jgi:mono/diheme cytochrome c family protein
MPAPASVPVVGRLTRTLGAVALMGLLAGVGAADLTTVSYERQIKPILTDRCYSCHGAQKQKGQLRLDSPAAIQTGGKSGAVVVAGHPDKSSLYARLLLPKDDDDVMPAKGDPMAHDQCELIRQWIASGADFADPVAGAAKAPATSATLPPNAPLPPTTTDVFAATLPAPDASAMKGITDAGGVVRALSKNQAAVGVDVSHAAEALDRLLPLVERIAANVLWLDLKGTAITDAQLHVLPKLKNLQRLHLERTTADDAAMAQVKLCTQLTYLNLYATKVSDAGLKQLAGLTNLTHLYVWQSAVTSAGIADLKKALPELEIDGAPDLPTPAADGAGQGKKGKKMPK